jgi:hypothetical protein
LDKRGRAKSCRAKWQTSVLSRVAALITVAGCTGQARLNELPNELPAEPVAGMAGGGTAGNGGSGGSLPVPPDLADASVGERDGASDPSDAGTMPEPRPPRPIEGGRVAGSISGGAVPILLEPPGPIDLEAHGYLQEEFLLEGEATAYAAQGELGLDGIWQATPTGAARYVSRLLVRRPAEAADFNGTVLVEWLNVTPGADAATGFAFSWEELLRGGYGYVAVSVQQTGVDALLGTDPVRYGRLAHPGDAYAYSIYAQAGAAIGWPGDVDPMGGLPVERLVGYGHAQSALRIITFINAVHPLTSVYDGYIIHGRGGWGAPVGVESDGILGDGTPVQVRGDLEVPVLQFHTESELFFPLGGTYHARQPDTDRLRTWEVAGAAHADQHLVGDGADLGCGPVNDGPQHVVVKAAVRAMHRWIKDGTLPASGETLTVTAAGDALARDAQGNALAGIRTPAVDVPIAMLSGAAAPENAWNPVCTLMGLTIPFTPEQLIALYPTHQIYVDKVTASARSAFEAGFILAEERAAIIAEAIAAPIPH